MLLCISWTKCLHVLYLHLGLTKKPQSVESTSEDEDEVEKQKVKGFKLLRTADVALPEFCKYLCYAFVSGTTEFHRTAIELNRLILIARAFGTKTTPEER